MTAREVTARLAAVSELIERATSRDFDKDNTVLLVFGNSESQLVLGIQANGDNFHAEVWQQFYPHMEALRDELIKASLAEQKMLTIELANLVGLDDE